MLRSMDTFDFYFDFSCPYAYLASTQLSRITRETGAAATLKPMLLGGLFKANKVPQNLYATLGPAKAKHNALDLQRHADLWGVPYAMPAGHPFRTVEALRAMLVVGPPYDNLMHAFYRAYWVDGRNIGSEEVLLDILNSEGHDGIAVLEATRAQHIKDELRARTDEAIGHGFFGAPGFMADGKLFWGQDRIEEVIGALGGTPGSPSTSPIVHSVDFYFDFSSPFACVGYHKVQKTFGAHAQLRPILLGGVFKAIGMHNVPLFSLSDSKKRWVHTDLMRQAERVDFDFKWPHKFPVNSVAALRIALQVQKSSPDLLDEYCRRVFAAYWSQGEDISSKELLEGLCTKLGLDGRSLVEGTQEPAVKQSLIDLTQHAVSIGVFGAPTTVVHRPESPPALFWGSDRMELALHMAQGHLGQST